MKNLTTAFVFLAALVFVASPAQAGTIAAGQSKNGIPMFEAVPPRTGTVPYSFPASEEDLDEIYSTLNTSTPDYAYDCCTGWGASAGNYLAAAFIPPGNYAAKVLTMALSNFSGAVGEVQISINADFKGGPGPALKRLQLSTSSLPEFGSCCETASVSLGEAGVSLTAGVQYWIVVRPSNQSPDLAVSWNWNSLGAQGILASSRGYRWVTQVDVLPAFSISGSATD